MLHLSTRWSFSSTRKLALSSIEPPTPHDRLILSRTYSVHDWVVPALSALCVGIVTGNPGVFQGYPYLYPPKYIPVLTGTGFGGLGLWVSQVLVKDGILNCDIQIDKDYSLQLQGNVEVHLVRPCSPSNLSMRLPHDEGYTYNPLPTVTERRSFAYAVGGTTDGSLCNATIVGRGIIWNASGSTPRS